jgi:hypothetical protein
MPAGMIVRTRQVCWGAQASSFGGLCSWPDARLQDGRDRVSGPSKSSSLVHGSGSFAEPGQQEKSAR